MLVLTLRKDPRARQEKARLDREVGGLEPFLEAMPTLIVCKYMYLNLEAGCHKVLEQMVEQRVHGVILTSSSYF